MSDSRLWSAALHAATLAAVFTLAVSSLTYFDFWWILRSGELIVQTRSVPATDPFSFTAAGRPWLNHMWATQALFYGLWAAGGRLLLILVKAGVVTATFAGVLVVLWARGIAPGLRCTTVLFLAWAGGPFWEIRPQIFTYLLVVVFLWLLREGWEQRASTWILIPALMVPWVNLHAGFLTGVGVVILVTAGATLARLADPGRRAQAVGLAGRGLALTALAAAATLIGPLGWGAYRFPAELMGSRAFMSATVEWFSPNFHNPAYRGFELALLLLIPAFAWGRARLSTVDIVLTLTFLHLALLSLRHIPLFLLVAAGPLAAGLEEAARTTLWRRAAAPRASLRWLALRLPTLWPLGTRPAVRLGAATGLILLGVATAWLAFRDPATNPLVLDLDERRYPRGALDFVLRERLPGPLFNVYAWGGYELWRLHPTYQVFIDGRTHVYGRDVLADYLEVVNAGEGWRRVLERWRIQTIIALRPSVLEEFLAVTPGWRAVFAGAQVVVFLREAGQSPELLARLPAVSRESAR